MESNHGSFSNQFVTGVDVYRQKLTVDRIARKCGLSLSRFAHLFRDETGRTPQQFIEARRMELARNLLRYSNLSVAEVASACGYEDPFYFSSRFRGTLGKSPRAYRGN